MKRVVVIGAGAAGLGALRSLSRHKDKLQFVAYEQSDRVGGTWIMGDPLKPTSMYETLRTNIPKEIMAFPDFPFQDTIYESFVGHKDVLEYLERFAQHYQLHKHIQFRHQVVEVDPVSCLADDDDTQTWDITVRNNVTGDMTTSQADAVIVCNGHYTYPLVPVLEGQETFPGDVVHTNRYKSPADYHDKIVLVLGAGPSGIDIAIDLLHHARKVYLSHNKARYPGLQSATNLEQVAGIERICGADLVLRDKTIVHADVVLLATGYRYAFPFLSSKCHPVIQDERIRSIYRMMVDINHPSLYYIGLNKVIIPFPQFHLQTEYAVARITGAVDLESRAEMEREYDAGYNERVVNRRLSDKYFHVLRNEQWTYNNQLAAASNTAQPSQVLEKLYSHVAEIRHGNSIHYKEGVYRLSEDKKDFKVLCEASNAQ